MEHLYASLLLWVQDHGLHGAFVAMLLESGGIPFPTELGFITAQGMLQARLCTYWEAFGWMASGHIIGSFVSYSLGRASDTALSRRLAHLPAVVTVHDKMRHWYARYGALAILLGRLIGQVRTFSSFAAGLSRVPVLPFALWTTVGTLILVAATMWFTAIGYSFWQSHRHLTVPIVVTLLIIFYGLPVYKIIEHLVKRRRTRRVELTPPIA
jgi:membrane protein DedA with SNARE-associated domain